MNTKTFYPIVYKIFVAFMIVLLSPVGSVLADTATNNAGAGATSGGAGPAWSNPGNIAADDTSYATVGVGFFSGSSESLLGTNYGFSIPAGATIDGIQVTIYRQSNSNSGDNINDAVVRLIKGGTIVGDNKATSSNWNTTWVAATYGGVSDLWGTTWTPAEINASNFGVALSVVNDETTTSRTASVDYMQITVTYTVPLPPTTTTLTSSLNPSNAGDFVTFTATVTPAVATGTVTFLDGATSLGTGTLSGGVASLGTNTLAAGSHNITAVYSGDASYSGSTSTVLVQVVNQAPTITSSAATTFAVGSPGNFTVTVSAYPAPAFTLTGDTLPSGVNFDTGTGVFSGTPDPGTVGVYNIVITASNGSSPDAVQNFTLTIIKGDQTISFTAPGSATYGSTFTINPTASSGLPVTITESGGCSLAGNVVTMTSGTAACVLTASQAGDASYNAASDVVQTVSAQRASATVSVDPSPHTSTNPSQSFYSYPMLFTITVTSPGGTPTGAVTLTGGTPAQNITSLPLDASGVTYITTSSLIALVNGGAAVPHGGTFVACLFLPGGCPALDFTYNGDDNFTADTETVSHTILPAPTQVTVTSDINPSAEGELVTFTITVSTIAPGTGIPPGTVTLWDGSTQIGGPITLVNGAATFSTSGLLFGSHNISARYVNTSDNYATSNNTANPYVQNVGRTTTTTLVSNNNPSIYGENITFTSTTTSATAGTITGSMSFYDGATLLGTDNTIVAGQATFTINSLVVGTHPITAVYSGDATFSTSTSAALNQAVDKATLDVVADDKTITYGDADPPFTFQYSGFVLGQTAAVVDTNPTCNVLAVHVDVNTYPIVCSGAADDNYTFNYINGTLTVDQKALTITADDQGKIYGDTFTFNGTEFTATGLIFSDAVTSVTLTSSGAVDTAPADTYDIVPSNAVGTGLGNYAITYINGTMTVAANALTISANDQSKTYGDVFTFNGDEFTISGLQSGDSVTSVTFTSAGASSAADVGTYSIVPSNAVGTGLGNYTIVYNNGTMDVNQRDLTFNPNSQTKVYGDLFTGYTGTFTNLRAGDVITPVYDSLGAVATAPVGVYPITVTLTDGPSDDLDNYIVTIDPVPAAVLTVTPKALTITADDQAKPYGTDFTFSGTEFTTNGLTNGDTVISVTLASVGAPAAALASPPTYPIVPSVAIGTGLSNYAITYVDGTMTVTKPDLVVTSDSQSKIYGDVFSAFTGSIVGIQNGDNITVTYDSLGAPADAAFGVYDIDITLVDPDGKLDNYNVIQNVGTLSVTRRDLTVVADDRAKIYGDSVTLTGTVTGVQAGDNITFTYSSSGVAPTAPVGTYPITITLNDPDNKIGNYNFTLTPATLTVTVRELIVTPDDQSKEYGSWFISFTGTITGIQNGENITANYASAGSPPSAGVGTYPIIATLNDPTGKLSNYDVTLNEGILTVSSSTLTVTADNKSVAYGSPDPAFTFTYTGFASGDTPADVDTPPTCTVAVPHTDVGSYPIICSGGADDAYTFTYVNGTLTVAPRVLTVTPHDKTKIYGDVFTAFTGTVAGIQFGDNITATYASAGAVATVAIGDYPITATLSDPDGKLVNYTVTLNAGTLSVTPRALTVSPGDKTKVYGDIFTAFTGTITGIQNSEAITATYSSPGAVATATVAGSPYPITAVLNAPAGVLANYSITLNTGELTVTPRALVVTPDNQTKVFGTVFTAFTGTITGIQNGDNITATYASAGAPAAAAVGPYPITATLNDPGGMLPNYSVTLNQGTLTVGLSVLTITANNQSIVYGDPDPAFTFTYSGFAPGDTPAVIDTLPTCQVAVPHNNVGTFPITCSGGVDDNYIFSYVPGTLTVTPRALTVTPDNKSKIYGDTFTAYTAVIAGIQGSDVITVNYTSAGAPATAAVGAYPITITLNDPGNRLPNYTVTLNTGTLTVTLRNLVVTPTDNSKTYGNVFTAFTGTILGIQNGDPITATYASPGAPAAATAGTYPITATLNAPAGVLTNYNVTANTGTLTVMQRDLTVIPADKTKIYGTTFTAFTGSLVGIQNSDPITATYSSPGAPAGAAVGSYPIDATLNASAGVLANYNVTLGTGTLEVNPATPTVAVTSNNNPAGVAELITFTATVTSSAGTPTGTVTFFDGANALSTVSLTGGTATLDISSLAAGAHTITVTYNGDANFNSNTSAPYVQGIGQTPTTTVVTSNNNPSVPGQSVTFTAIVSATTGTPTGTVTFMDGATTLGAGTLSGGIATLTTNSLVSGSHSITASYGGDPDFFGSVSPVLVQVVIPDTTITSNPPDPDNDTTPSFSFSSPDPSATFQCRLDDGTFSACDSGDTFGPLSAGNHTFEVRAVNTSNNADPTPASYTWIIDLTAPDTNIDTNPPAITNIVDASFTFSSVASDLAGFECRLDGDVFAPCTGGIPNSQDYTGLSAGPHTFEVRAVDNVGNVDTSPATYTWIIDLGFPVVLFNGNTNPGDSSVLGSGPTQISVAFSKDIKNDGSPGAANYTANFLLVDDGVNNAFDTLSCIGGLVADDVVIPMAIPNYSNNGGPGPFIATATINGGIRLPDGTYRLFVCGTTSIEDLAGNELNNGANDTIITFTVDRSSGGGNNGGGQTGSGLLIPVTGFPQGQMTALPAQPEELAYESTELWMEIPKLGLKTPIMGIPQTKNGWDISWLGRNAGWLNGSAFPTWKGNSVITAHVWDALNKPGPFAQLINLKYGDQVKIHAYGQIYTYEIVESSLILPSNIATAFKHEEKSWLTLITCEGYQEKTGVYTQRRMVRATLVKVEKE